MSKRNNRYWLETEHFFSNHTSTTSSDTPYRDTKSQTRISRYEIFPEKKRFCNKSTPLCTTQYPVLVITSEEGFIYSRFCFSDVFLKTLVNILAIGS